MSDIKLYFMSTGTMQTKVQFIKMNQGMNDDYEIPIPFYLLTHPKGHTLIDGGNAVEVVNDAEGYWGKEVMQHYKPVMTLEDGCVAQIERLGVDPADIRFVLQSHLHIDHTGGVGRFPNATHIVQRIEYEYAFTPDWFSASGYCRKDFDREGLKWHFLEGETDDFFDVYGDGVLTTVFTPGHSVGHQSILIRLPEAGPMLLTIDAAYTTDHWNRHALPGLLTSAKQAVRSVEKLRFLAEKTGAKVITGHDPIEWHEFKKAPAFYC